MQKITCKVMVSLQISDVFSVTLEHRKYWNNFKAMRESYVVEESHTQQPGKKRKCDKRKKTVWRSELTDHTHNQVLICGVHLRRHANEIKKNSVIGSQTGRIRNTRENSGERWLAFLINLNWW